MSFSSSQLAKQLSPYRNAPRWLVAYSGGVDSHVLLHALLQYPDHPPIEAVHINHQLQDESGQWSAHCQHQVDKLGIPLHTVNVTVAAQGSPEEQARRVRYQAFESLLKAGDILMMGHHQDDQVETLMLRLLRGSGSRGAAAMPANRPLGQGSVVRPLLDIPRQAIEGYARQQQLQWVEDPSNQSSDFDRNYLRLELLPAMAARWPEYRQTLARAASLSEESAALNDELALLDFERAAVSSQQASIPLTLLEALSPARQKNLLRFWLNTNGFSLPAASQLEQLLEQVLNADSQAQPLISWGKVQIRRFNGLLYAMDQLAEFDGQQVFHWDLSAPLALEPGSCLLAKPVSGEGIDRALLASEPVTVRFRQGGERCQPDEREHSQSLKKLFQEYELEQWLRDRAPLVYCGDKLVAVADLWICKGWRAAPGRAGIALQWQRAI
ncbi:tRNA lysidine(34) synthetase TilS [Oceanicoccus sagamiensis]|uniref:tRNA(Ile)-lysidine synthase n=1 Tax=Oceanicoccus sagamiensis TaxID=716816 RepID=A0A1X9NM53_9GAMM|nr:tRNA lysidine(34) synthetase TilS [Oceanicoccus sagamiensis]ARN75003.1 tRNA lysidine(34) synthetase TilS [Oceanicoccus sagamiensis]